MSSERGRARGPGRRSPNGPEGFSGEDPTLSIVVPVMNESKNVPTFLERLRAAMDPLEETYEVVFVDDGSTDDTWTQIQRAAMDEPCVKGLSLSRNFGHQNALFAGLRYAAGRAIVSIDGDLQHPPEVVPELVGRWRDGARIVKTCRRASEDATLFKRLSSRWFYRAFSKLSGLPTQEGTSDFRLLDRTVVDAIDRMADPELFLRGMVDWVGFETDTVDYRAEPRGSGVSKYDLRRMIRFATSAVVSFSAVPLKAGLWLGFATSIVAFGMILYSVLQYFRGQTVPGWASLLTFTAFMFGMLFILLGVIGVYLGSVLEGVKRRPRFLIEKAVNLEHPIHDQMDRVTDLHAPDRIHER